MSQPGDYRLWQAKLQAAPYSRKVYVTQINRTQWLTTRDDSFRPQIAALHNVVEQARRETGAEKVSLVCHSAGGRIARLWMGGRSYNGNPFGGHRYVQSIIFLGSPYTTEEPWAVRSSSFANTNYPGAYYSEIKYVSLIGKALFGKPNGNISERLAYQSYRTLSPRYAQRWGDGVITLESANVPGAENIVLDGIYHVSVLGRPGYGDPKALGAWGKYLLEA